MLKKILIALFSVIALIVIIVLVITFTNSSLQVQVSPFKVVAISDNAVFHLSEAVQIKTISYDVGATDTSSFAEIINLFKKNYPLTDSILQKEIVNGSSLLYKWQGKSNALKPVLLLAHLDVVPVDEQTINQWQQPPFSGNVIDNYVWGRGSIDDKLSAVSILEATEILLKENFQPERTIYFAFGHDEETGGQQGATNISKLLSERNIHAEYALDEGLIITDGIVPGIKKPVALIGIAEKGNVTLQLSVNENGGHSSMPEAETNIGILSKAIYKLQQHPFPSDVSGAMKDFVKVIGPEMPFFEKMAFSNMWLFNGIFINELEKSASGSASVRTTTAPTVFNSGMKENVLPNEAKAIINFRILPGETIESVQDHVKKIIDDHRINIVMIKGGENPSPVSSDESDAYHSIEKIIRGNYPDAIVVPSLVLAETDSRHYFNVADNVYRFQPVKMNSEDLNRLHGINERVSVSDYKKAISFYYYLMKEK